MFGMLQNVQQRQRPRKASQSHALTQQGVRVHEGGLRQAVHRPLLTPQTSYIRPQGHGQEAAIRPRPPQTEGQEIRPESHQT